MKLKFFSYLSGMVIQSLCIEYNWCTRMTSEDFNNMLALADSTNNANLESTIEKVARLIHAHSDTEMTLLEIAGEIYRNAVVRFVEEKD